MFGVKLINFASCEILISQGFCMFCMVGSFFMADYG
jgi:hypothetical protein